MEYKCYDHDHLTGKYRSTVCNDCNLSKLRVKPEMYKTHEYFHNAESFDNHLTINGIFETNNKVSETVKREILSRTDLSKEARLFLEKDFAKDKPISVIARTSEKTLMLSNGRVNINDSYKTTMCSLHTLIYNLVVNSRIYYYCYN